jgi:hypothetical protein
VLGTGTISGAVLNTGGMVKPGDTPGTLTINGNYTQGSGGTLTIELGGSAAGNYSVLDVTGRASLQGTVDFTTVNGFRPGAVRSTVPSVELLSLDDSIRRAGKQLGFRLQPR